MDDQVPTASTPVYKIRTKNRQRSSKPYERPSQSFREKIVDSVSSIVPDWLKSAASYLTNAEPEEEEVDVQEQSVLSPGSSRSSSYQELPSEIRDASIRPSLSVLREEREGDHEPQESNSECNENHTKNVSQHTSQSVHRDTDDGQRASTSEAPAAALSEPKDPPTTHLSLSVGTMNRLEIPEDNLKRLKVNLSKRSRLSMPCTSGSISVSPPAKASRHETVDAETSRLSRNNSELFKMSNASFSSSFTFGPRSPFYDGKTSFGGSSSRRMSRLAYPYSMAGRKIAPVLKVRASEMAKSDPGKSEALSCASMKILDVINKESSLLEDTKKIPLNDSGLSNRTVFNNFVKSSSRRVSSTRTRLSMPSHITTSVLNKSIASTHQSDTNNLDWRLNPNTFADDVDAAGVRESHKTLLQEPPVPDKVGGKMKSSLSKSSLSNRSSSKVIEETETASAVDLPQVSLPLKSLPSFNLEFKKSDPMTKDVNQFKFSWPSTYSDSTRDLPKVNSTAKAFTFSTPKESREGSRVEAEINPSNISTTNVTSATSSESPAISDASWSCPKCIKRNDPQVIKCLACKTLKPDTNEKKESATTVNNSNCSSSSNNNNNKNNNSNNNTSTNNKKVDFSSSLTTNTTITSSWGDKFKKPPGTWTCDVCMVDNKIEHSKCVACETERPGSQATANSSISTDSANVILPNALSKKWTCDTCYVTNEENRDTCISCEMSRKTGDTNNTKANYSGYKFNLTDKSPPPFKFGCTESSTTSNTSSIATIGFKFGSSETSTVTNAAATSAIAFKFGSNESSTMSNPQPPPPPPTTSNVGFKFGSTEPSTVSSVPLAATTSAIDFKFGSTESSTVSNVSSVAAPPAATTSTTTIGFKFGSTETSTVSNAPSTATIGFAKPTFNGSNSTVTSANNTVAAAAAAANATAPTVGAKTTAGFNFNPSTPLNFSFGGNASTAPKFGVSTSNGSLGSTDSFTFTAAPPAGAKTTAFNFNSSTPPNFSFGANACMANKFGVSTSNGSLGSTVSFNFTAAAAPGDPLRGENTSGRVMRKAKRRLLHPPK